jgi:hypothetical protein
LSYGSDTKDSYERASVYADRILRGEKASELPVQAPAKFQLVINLKTAKAIGLQISESFLIRADEVIDQSLCLLRCECRLLALSALSEMSACLSAFGVKRTSARIAHQEARAVPRDR